MSLLRVPALAINFVRVIVMTLNPSAEELHDILRGTQLSERAFLHDDICLSWQQLHRLIANIQYINADPGLWLQAGLRTDPAILGCMGIAAMTSNTLRESLAVLSQYMPVYNSFFALKYTGHDTTFDVLSFDFLPEQDAVLRVLMESVIASAFSCLESLLRQPLVGAEIHFTFARPTHIADFEKAFHGSVLHFDAARTVIYLPQSYASRSLISRDKQMQKLALQQCEAVHDVIYRKGPIAGRVLSAMQAENGHLLALDDLAEQMGLSRSALCRRLKEEGTNYQQLLDGVISRRAVRLMSMPGSNVATIAAELGYAEPVCFRRAFRRWFGVTPSQYRESHC